MTVQQHLTDLCSYNAWANERIIDMIRQADRDVYDLPVENSFPSIRKTIFHIWDAQVIWLSRLQGNSPTDWPSKTKNQSVEGFETDFLDQSKNFFLHVREAQSDFFNLECTYQNLRGEQCVTNHSSIILHCMNHSTYHRGQIITMLRTLGIQGIQSTDYITYLRK
jgi:uncharacterized damage-inducible protein DinB